MGENDRSTVMGEIVVNFSKFARRQTIVHDISYLFEVGRVEVELL